MKKWFAFLLALIMCLSLCACGKSEAVKETEQAIKAIGKVTMSSQDAIEEASNLFDALTSEEQAKVSNRNDLSKAKDEFQGLVDYYIEIADRIVSAYTPQLGGAYKFTGEYLEDEKTYVVMMFADEAKIDEIVKDKPYFLAIFACILAPLFFIQKGTNWNTIQFLYYALFLSNIFLAKFL